jgi:hypothetical protein
VQLSWRCQRFRLDARVGMFSALEHLYASSLQLTAPVALPRVTPIISDLYACPLWLTAPLASPRVPLRVKYVNRCVAASLCMLVLGRPPIAFFVQAARSRSALLSRLTRGALEPQISVCSTKMKILCGESFRTQKNLLSVVGDLGSVVVVVPLRPPTLLEVPNAANVEVVQERFTRFRLSNQIENGSRPLSEGRVNRSQFHTECYVATSSIWFTSKLPGGQKNGGQKIPLCPV